MKKQFFSGVNIEVGAYLSDKPLDVDELLHTLEIYEHQRKFQK